MSAVLRNLGQDLRQAWRSLRRAPGFVAIVVATLALGIGINTAMFSVVDTIVLRPLPYPDSDRLVAVGIRTPQFGTSTYGVRTFEYLEMGSTVDALEELGAYSYGGGTLTDGGDPEEPTALYVDPGFEEVLGLEPMLGRRFREEDCERGANPVVMLGEEIWRRRYAADPELVGSEVRIDEIAYEVIGIVPDSFRFPDEAEPIQLFRTLIVDATSAESEWGNLGLVARLTPGATERQADEQLGALAAALAEARPRTNAERGFYAQPLHDAAVSGVRTSLLTLWGAVGFVLVLACMNAANLLIARGAARSHETAVSAALGASRWRVVQRVLCESLSLAVVAAGLGLLVAQWGIELAVALGLDALPRGYAVALDGRVLGMAMAMAIGCGLLYGLLPALQASRVDLVALLQEGGGRASQGRGSQRVRQALTVGQVAIACVLSIGAGLLIRSSLAVRATEPGFAWQSVLGLTMWADAPRDAEPGWSVGFYDRILEEIEAVPGVVGASLTSASPWQSLFDESTSFQIEGHPEFASGEPARSAVRVVSAETFGLLEIPLLAGRGFGVADDLDGTVVAVVNRAFSERYWPDGDAVGQWLQAGPQSAPVEIVGVVGDIRERRLDREAVPTVYVPFRQNPRIAMTVMVRTDRDPELLERAVLDAVWASYPTQGIWRVATLRELLRTSLARESLYTTLLVGFAGVAALLAAIGIYGVMSYSVTRRTREIGIRMALGARGGDVLRQVLLGGLKLTAVGLLVGLPFAVWVTRLLEQLLYDVSPLDPLTYLGVALLIVLAAVAASLAPAWRATRVPPSLSLRAS